ncbi:hypothetical protein BDP27DRAFT_597305 [Rhodocollybia butyracea]|uniref:Uncharacterized protein n=1 Tax=Rhodocollybia butyracea TaxID=206335 RepID=A0A9P5Q2V5_9AGAR|nr:hypothetical protein BDP27DRAFT_597305 [Rhodocollybia butyracea]
MGKKAEIRATLVAYILCVLAFERLLGASTLLTAMAPYNHPKVIKSPTKASKRSPLLYRGHPTRNVNRNAPDSRLGKHIQENSPDRGRHRRRVSTYDYLFDVPDPVEDQDADEGEYFERPTFTWEDEETLVSDLLHNNHEQQSEDGKLISLADSIQSAFAVHSKELLDDVADTLVPAANRVKHAYQILNDQIDESYALGLLEFDEASKKIESVALTSQNEVKKAYNASQARIRDLFKQLDEAYARRDKLWVDFEKALNETINPAIDNIKTHPLRMERTLVTLEKQSKQIAKEGGGKAAYLKLLNKLKSG